MRQLLLVSLCFWSVSAKAQDTDWNVNLDSRLGLTWQQEPGPTPKTNTTSSISTSVADLLLTAKQKRTYGHWRINLLDPLDPLTSAEVGLATNRIGMAFGKVALPIGGLAAARIGAVDWWRPRYLSASEFSYFEPGAYLWVDLGVVIKLVAFQDVVVDDDQPLRSNRNAHPTVGGEVRWDQSAFTVLLQGAGYDNNKSHWIDAAGRWTGEMARLELSYHYQNDSYRIETADLVRDIGKVLSGLALRAGVDWGLHSAFWEWNEFEVTQANEPGISLDQRENSYSRDDTGALGERLWNDHGTMTLLGYAYDRQASMSWYGWIGAEQGRWLRRNSDHVELFRTLRAEAGLRLTTTQ